ncbi:MAG: hypothetical protein LBC42_01065 [Puniceicoccales bacterium]|jgi:hypothetical protein|nr:hypothetical protein [Puniceicoccales bacterium]
MLENVKPLAYDGPFVNLGDPSEKTTEFLTKHKTGIIIGLCISIGALMFFGAVIATGGFAIIPSVAVLLGWIGGVGGGGGVLMLWVFVGVVRRVYINRYEMGYTVNIMIEIILKIPAERLLANFREILQEILTRAIRKDGCCPYNPGEISDMTNPSNTEEQLRSRFISITKKFPYYSERAFKKMGYWPKPEVYPLPLPDDCIR